MGKALVFLAILASILLGCKKNDDKGNDLPKVISEIIQQSEKECPSCGVTIRRGVWNGQEVYAQLCNGPTCLCMATFYSSTGEILDVPIEWETLEETIFICRNEP